MPSMRATVNVRECLTPAVSSTWSTIASPIGTIITAVAVLAIHMERKAAATMKPRMMREGPPPTAWMMLRAMRLCRFHRCMESAIMKPPRKRTIVPLK